MKRSFFFPFMVAAALAAGTQGYAYRSPTYFQDRAQVPFAATYLGNQTQTINGRVVSIMFRDPLFSFVHVEALDEHGRMQRWAVQWAPERQLGETGVTHATLRLGDRVIITGNPGRNPEDHRLFTRAIVRPVDGWRWGGMFD